MHIGVGILDRIRNSSLCGDLLGIGEDLIVVHVAEEANLTHDGADMADSLDDIADAGLALGVYHGCGLTDAPEALGSDRRRERRSCAC